MRPLKKLVYLIPALMILLYSASYLSALPPVTSLVIDDGDAGYTTSGPWRPWTSFGYLNDVQDLLPGAPSSAYASWSFTDLSPGQYRVAVTWAASSNRSAAAPYQILDSSSVLGQVTVDQRANPVDFSYGGRAWSYLGTRYLVHGTALEVRLKGASDGAVIADAVKIERVGDLPGQVEVREGATVLADGSGVVSFGNAMVGKTVQKTLTVTNVGQDQLLLNSTINLPTGFSLVTGFGATSLPSGAQTTFTVQMNAASEGSPGGILSFANSDPGDGLYEVHLTGTVTTTRVIDDGDAGYTTSGPWRPWTSFGYLNDVQDLLPGAPSSAYASWSFTDLSPGQYRVAVTWAASSNRSAAAPYQILDSSSVLGQVTVDQRANPVDFSYGGRAWSYLGTRYLVHGTALEVRLKGASDGAVIADAVKIERVGEPFAQIQVWDGSARLFDGYSTVNFGSTSVGAPITKTFTVKNVGASDLILTTPISIPAGFSIVSSFGSVTVPPGGQTSFTVRLNAVTFGTSSGLLAFFTNDPGVSRFDVTATGSVNRQIIDDGDAGFTTTGAWPAFSGGYQGGMRAADSGLGDSVATWTFPNLVPGIYRVSATWASAYSRADNAPYSMLDGSTLRATATLNQQLPPDDFNDTGVAWEDLGQVFVHGATLKVQLSNAAHLFQVIADAVRIERVASLPAAPDIEVWDGPGGVQAIANGTGVSSFGAVFQGSPVQKTYTVRNVGAQALNLNASIGLPAGFSVVSGLGSTTLGPNSETTFTLRMDAAGPGSPSGLLALQSNDPDENPFRFTLTGGVNTSPEIEVSEGVNDLKNVSGFADMGETHVGVPVQKTFTVKNTGSASLTLAGPISVPEGISVASTFGSSSLAPGETTTFTLQMDATAVLAASGGVSITTNDPDENPFTFGIAGLTYFENTSGPTLNVRDFGAVGDGVTDNRAAFQTTLNQVSAAGGGKMYVPNGTYLFSDGILIPSNTTVEGESWAAVLRATATPTVGALLTNVHRFDGTSGNDNITIRNLTIDINNLGPAGGNGITLKRVKGFLVENCQVMNCKGYGIWMFEDTVGAGNVRPTSHGRVTRCTVTNASEHIETVNSEFCQVVGNQVNMVAGRTVNGILMYGFARNLLVAKNVVRGVGNGIDMESGANHVKLYQNDVEVTGTDSLGFSASDRATAYEIYGGRYVSQNQYALAFYAGTNQKIIDAYIEAGTIAVYTESLTDVLMRGCTIIVNAVPSKGTAGIYLQGAAQRWVIDKNTVEMRGQPDFCCSYSLSSPSGSQNTVINNTFVGGNLSLGAQHLFENNTVQNIRVYVYGNDNTVRNNLMKNTSIIPGSGTGNLFTGNIFTP